MALKAKITQPLISGLKPTGKKYPIHDDGPRSIPGFHARVSAQGRAVFYQSYRTHNGDRRHFKIGPASDWVVGKAREKALEVRAAAMRGEDPHQDRQEARRRTLAQNGRTVRTFLYGLWRELETPKLKSGEQMFKRVEFLCKDARILDHDLARLRTIDLERWRARRLADGVAQTTLNRDISAIRNLVKAAVRLGVIEEYPLRDFKHLKVSDDNRVRYLEIDERERLYAALEGYRNYLRSLVHLLLNTGLRRGEALSLTWKDVDLQRDQITVRAAKAKTGKGRYVPLNRIAKTMLVEWIGSRTARGLVFPSPVTGKRMVSLANTWEKLMRQAEISDFRIHDCRHDFASQLVMRGVDLLAVSKLLGHSSILMTMRYAHLAPDHLRDAVAVLDV